MDWQTRHICVDFSVQFKLLFDYKYPNHSLSLSLHLSFTDELSSSLHAKYEIVRYFWIQDLRYIESRQFIHRLTRPLYNTFCPRTTALHRPKNLQKY